MVSHLRWLLSPVVHRHHHHVLGSGQDAAVVQVQGGRPRGEGAAVDPDHDGQRPLLAVVQVGRPDVQVEAVFAHRGVGVPHLGAGEPWGRSRGGHMTCDVTVS